MEAKDALFVVAKVIVNLFSLIGDASTHGRLGKLTVKTGPHAGTYSGAYVPDSM